MTKLGRAFSLIDNNVPKFFPPDIVKEIKSDCKFDVKSYLELNPDDKRTQEVLVAGSIYMNYLMNQYHFSLHPEFYNGTKAPLVTQKQLAGTIGCSAKAVREFQRALCDTFREIYSEVDNTFF